MTSETTDLPTAVTEYLQAAPDADPAALANLFTEDAIVVDDGKTYRGRSEIAAWRSEVAHSFTYTTTRLRTEEHADAIVVINRIEGNFPGGRIDLANRFTVDDAKRISSLMIAPATEG
ncbi:nuclear transport factor 2 family protein [Williamsia muralis]|uniref:nuclear transport factor 2 family protein n=1 Tax=Williamsia marianensis TaxID=85044 RepID=UPI003F144FCF